MTRRTPYEDACHENSLLEDENEALREEVSDLKRQIDDLGPERDALQARVEELDAAYTKATTELIMQHGDDLVRIRELENPWVSVDERLPELHFGLSDEVIIPTTRGIRGITITRLRDDGWLGLYEPDFWMPIPPLPEKEKRDE